MICERVFVSYIPEKVFLAERTNLNACPEPVACVIATLLNCLICILDKVAGHLIKKVSMCLFVAAICLRDIP